MYQNHLKNILLKKERFIDFSQKVQTPETICILVIVSNTYLEK